MRAVVQRVTSASVEVDGETVAKIGPGLLVLLGVGTQDTEDDAAHIVKKIAQLRIFNDPDGKFNLSLEDIQGAVLLVSQFTLYGDARKGNRPSFIDAARRGCRETPPGGHRVSRPAGRRSPRRRRAG